MNYAFDFLFTVPTTIRMPLSPRLTPLPLDLTDITAGLFSLSVELQPLRTADEVAALLLALRRYPRDLPHRDEKIVHALGEKYNSAQLKDLIGRLDAASPAFMQLSSSLPFDGDAKIYLVCPVDNCVACAHAPPLVVKTRTVPSSLTVVTESGLLQGVSTRRYAAAAARRTASRTPRAAWLFRRASSCRTRTRRRAARASCTCRRATFSTTCFLWCLPRRQMDVWFGAGCVLVSGLCLRHSYCGSRGCYVKKIGK